MANPAPPLQNLAIRVHVFPAEALWVTAGANQGDPVGLAEECQPGDIYRLEREAGPVLLLLDQSESDASGAAGMRARVAKGSALGSPGQPIRMAARLTLMAPDGERVEVLILEIGGAGRFALPLSPLAPQDEYTLLAVSDDPGAVQLTDILCIALARGTSVTVPGGVRRPIETLAPGDLILTRDNGPQPLRWIGRANLRAHGAFAPVAIAAGTLGNIGELVVGQHHRIFLYQRAGKRLGATAELLVQAKHLVDGDRVRLREGGFVEYFSLVFDRHEIIYAEGIPCESLLVSEALLNRLPEDLAQAVRERFPGLSQSPHFGTEAGREALDAAGPGALFRRGRDSWRGPD